MYDWVISLFMCQADSVVSSITTCETKSHSGAIRTYMRVMSRFTYSSSK